MGLYMLNNLRAAPIYLLRRRDSPLLAGQGGEGSFFPEFALPQKWGYTQTAGGTATAALSYREVGMETCVLINSAACVITSTAPETEDCQAVN